MSFVAEIKPATMFEIKGTLTPEIEQFVLSVLARQTRVEEKKWFGINTDYGITFICAKKLTKPIEKQVREFLWAFSCGATFYSPDPLPSGWDEIEGDVILVD